MDPQMDVLNELKNNMGQRMGQRLRPPEPEMPMEGGGDMDDAPPMPDVGMGMGMPGMEAAPMQNVNQQDPNFSANGALPKNIIGQNPSQPGVEFSDDEMQAFAGMDEEALGLL